MTFLRALALSALLLIAAPASAQVCDPVCTGGMHCVWTDDTHTGTECYDPDSEIVVPGEPGNSGGTTFKDIVYGVIVPIVDFGIVPLLYSLAFIFFLIGMLNLFFSSSEEKRKSGRQFALWGIIGFAVISSVWGLVKLLLTLLPTGVNTNF